MPIAAASLTCECATRIDSKFLATRVYLVANKRPILALILSFNKCDLLDSYCERRYAARSDGVLAIKSWGKCAHSNCVASPAVSFSSLRRQLSRSHQHRLRDARDEKRSRPDRFGLRHSKWNFFHRLFRTPNPGGGFGRTLERAAATLAYVDYVGRINN